MIPPLESTSGPPAGTPVSRIPVRVRFAETDLMGIVHHATYLIYVEEARVEYLTRRGMLFADWVRRGVHFPIVDTRLRYRSAAFFYDALEVEIWVGDLTRVTARFDFRIHRKDGDKDTVLCEGYTTIACIDNARTLKRIPQEIADVLTSHERV